ncbi:hypothetical protein KP509_06G050000 [Ceratopteris richardii]|uniref:SAM-dependent methyltransferase TRM5/TYW2-type domain-containing protein n=1 Tax=Ceratopteris richardii TaxID=49495 RepID=A0A8T2UMI1_CERRI|nr:hypothetical protein KP509_06G050000 [Ceratopteris richardii]
MSSYMIFCVEKTFNKLCCAFQQILALFPYLYLWLWGGALLDERAIYIVIIGWNTTSVHWDWELAAERRRLVQTFNKKDIVCDVFAGAGALTLLSARKVWRVFANDPITDALKYLARNTIDNKLQAKVELYNLDCSMFVKTLANFKKPVLMTQIVFSLPTSPDTLSGALKGAFDRKIWPVHQPLPIVHVYGYSHMPSWGKNFSHLIVERLQLKMETVELHVVKSLDSTREMICASFRLPEQVAFYD